MVHFRAFCFFIRALKLLHLTISSYWKLYNTLWSFICDLSVFSCHHRNTFIFSYLFPSVKIYITFWSFVCEISAFFACINTQVYSSIDFLWINGTSWWYVVNPSAIDTIISSILVKLWYLLKAWVWAICLFLCIWIREIQLCVKIHV